jgi:hypothetical protein
VVSTCDALGVRDAELELYVRRTRTSSVEQHYARFGDEAEFSRLEYTAMVVPLFGRSFWYGDLSFRFRAAESDADSERRLLLQLLGEHVAEHIETHLVASDRERFVVSRFPKPGRRAG